MKIPNFCVFSHKNGPSKNLTKSKNKISVTSLISKCSVKTMFKSSDLPSTLDTFKSGHSLELVLVTTRDLCQF